MIKPKLTGNEIKLSQDDMLVSKTDAQGIITYGNHNFIKISGYKESELIGSPHSIIRHPDMPKAIFYFMWRSIKSGKNIMAVVKNLAKNGDYYWVTTDFNIQKDREGCIRNYIAFRQAPPRDVIKTIEPIYKEMVDIESKEGMDASIEYFENMLKSKNMTYDEYIEELAKPKGIAGTIFAKMKDLFS